MLIVLRGVMIPLHYENLHFSSETQPSKKKKKAKKKETLLAAKLSHKFRTVCMLNERTCGKLIMLTGVDKALCKGHSIFLKLFSSETVFYKR